MDHHPIGRSLRDDGRQPVLCPALGRPDRCVIGPFARRCRADRHLDADRLRRRAVADRAAGRPGREPAAGADPDRGCRHGAARRGSVLAPGTIPDRRLVHRRRQRRRPGDGGVCRPFGAGCDPRPRGRQRDERADARHHAGAARFEFHRRVLRLAYGVLRLGGVDGAAGRIARLGAAAAPAGGEAALRGAARLHGASGADDAGAAPPGVVSRLPVRRVQPVLDDGAAAVGGAGVPHLAGWDCGVRARRGRRGGGGARGRTVCGSRLDPARHGLGHGCGRGVVPDHPYRCARVHDAAGVPGGGRHPARCRGDDEHGAQPARRIRTGRGVSRSAQRVVHGDLLCRGRNRVGLGRVGVCAGRLDPRRMVRLSLCPSWRYATSPPSLGGQPRPSGSSGSPA